MKKISLLSMLVYVFFVILGIYFLITGLQLIEELSNTPGGFDGKGYPMNHVLGIILIIIGLVCLFFKLLQGTTRLGIFAIPCMLIDAACVFFLWSAFVLNGSNTPLETGALILYTVPQTFAFFSNAASLARI